MTTEAPEIRLIREALESTLHPNTAASLLFSALEERGGVPQDHPQMLALLRGPLRRGLLQQLGEPVTSDVLERMEQMLLTVLPSGRRRRDDEITHTVAVSHDALKAIVVSGRTDLANRLMHAVGQGILVAFTAEDETTLRARLRVKPGLVLVDGVQFPHIEPAALVATLAVTSPDCVCAVWGSDLPYAQAVLATATEAHVATTPFARHEGIDPLIDLIRSRRA